MKTVMRISGHMWAALKGEVRKCAPKETTMLLIAKRLQASQRRVYIASALIVLGEEEAHRTPYSVQLNEEFLRSFWPAFRHINAEGQYSIIVVHSHPFDDNPHLSPIDHHSLEHDFRLFLQAFSGNSDLVHVVLNTDLTVFDGLCKTQEGSSPLDHIIVLDNPLKVLSRHKAASQVPAIYERAALIPEFDLATIAPLRVGIIGAGGLGHLALEFVTMQGIGEHELTMVVDHDRIEESNRQRISYATPTDDGEFKAERAISYLAAVRPQRRAKAVNLDCFGTETQTELAACDVLITCVDSELARYVSNALSSAYLSVNLDLATKILIEECNGRMSSIAGGHARLFVPEVTPCHLCSIGLDQERLTAEKARRALSGSEQNLLQRAGYLENLTAHALPEPSVYSLNAAVASTGLLLLERYLTQGTAHHLLRFFSNNFSIYLGKSTSNPLCPFCGENSLMGSGEVQDIESLLQKGREPEADFTPELEAMQQEGGGHSHADLPGRPDSTTSDTVEHESTERAKADMRVKVPVQKAIERFRRHSRISKGKASELRQAGPQTAPSVSEAGSAEIPTQGLSC